MLRSEDSFEILSAARRCLIMSIESALNTDFGRGCTSPAGFNRRFGKFGIRIRFLLIVAEALDTMPDFAKLD